MRRLIQKIKFLFSSVETAVDVEMSIVDNIVYSVIILLVSAFLLLKNSLSSDIIGISIFPFPQSLSFYARFGLAFLVQTFALFLPFTIVLGKRGLMTLLKNLALIQFINLVIILTGFIFESVFWPLYKILPISGLAAQSIFDAVFLLYPVLILVIFRYIFFWILALKSEASAAKVFFTTLLYCAVCAGLWMIWRAL